MKSPVNQVFISILRGEIRYLVCEPLERAGFFHAFSTRRGGVSPLPEKALNLAFKNDRSENVRENRTRFLQAIGAPRQARLATAQQTHSNQRQFLASFPPSLPEVDALLSLQRDVLLGVETADCLPILIGDPKTGLFAAVHAGWRGTLGRITQLALEDLKRDHGLDPRSCVAALGPSACAACYEVGEEVASAFRKEFSTSSDLIASEGGRTFLDVPKANARQLEEAGVPPESIHLSPYCTMHQNDLFFSYRREGKDSPDRVGRMLSVIGKGSSLTFNLVPETRLKVRLDPFRVEISARAADQIRAGNLWVFSNEVRMKKPYPERGGWCWFVSREKIVATGYFNPHSLIAGRVVSEGQRDDLDQIFKERLESAFEKRKRLMASGSARLVFSEADFLPGLILDWYSGVLVLQSSTAGIDAVLERLEKIIPEAFQRVFGASCSALVLRGDSSIRRLEGVEDFCRVTFGDEEALVNGSFSDNGVRTAADFLKGQKTGYFLDQRDNRNALQALVAEVKPKSLLDLFSYSGGWGLSALKAGTPHVTFVDESAEALRLVERGLALNEFPSSRAHIIRSGVFEFLEKDTGSYDIVVADPPAFVKSKKNLPQAIKGYEKLNRLSWRRLSKGGILVACSCSYHLAEEEFMALLRRAVAKEGGRAHVLRRGMQAGDHPVLLSMPETSYLKCAFLKKL